jgi:chaperone protein EcpD
MKHPFKTSWRLSAALFCLMSATSAYAGVEVVPLRTNVVDSKRETTISIENKGSGPELIQIWATPHEVLGLYAKDEKPPFIFSPPLFKIDAGQTQKVRVIYSGRPVTSEQMYRLNVQEVPQAPSGGGSSVQFAFRSVLPLVVRNEKMSRDGMIQAVKVLKWSLVNNALTVRNDSDYVFILDQIQVADEHLHLDKNNQLAINPHTQREIHLDKAVSASKVSYRWFNDAHIPQATESQLTP